MARPEAPLSLEINKPRDHCAVVGVISFSGRDVAPLVRLSLHDQQNRGEDGAGIATFGEYSGTFNVYKDAGLVAGVFPDGKLAEEKLHGALAVGHNRYATSGSKEKASNLQPYIVGFDKRSLALAHNGNIPEQYLEQLRQELPPGIPFQSDTDSEVIAWRILFAKGQTWREKVINGINGVVGAYSLVIATDEGDLFGIKDTRGIRPLVFARMEDGAALVSETRGLGHIIGIRDKEEVGNGQMVHVNKSGDIRIDQIFPKKEAARCFVEPIYFKNPYSREGESEVRLIRERMGQALAQEFQAPSDWTIVGIPDSGIQIADGYASALGRRPMHLLMKDRYRPQRTFISESQEKREHALNLKFLISEDVAGKKLAIIDDSVIRGNTTRRLVEDLKEMGALEVHVLSGSPKFVNTCDLGIDIPTQGELQALKSNGESFEVNSEDEIAKDIGADSIHYLSLEGLQRAVGGNDFCTNCFNGVHPIRELGESIIQLYTASEPISTLEPLH